MTWEGRVLSFSSICALQSNARECAMCTNQRMECGWSQVALTRSRDLTWDNTETPTQFQHGKNLSLETLQPSPKNPALHAGLGMYVNITDDIFTSASLLHFQLQYGPALVRISISQRTKKHLLGLSNSQLPISCSTEVSPPPSFPNSTVLKVQTQPPVSSS